MAGKSPGRKFINHSEPRHTEHRLIQNRALLHPIWCLTFSLCNFKAGFLHVEPCKTKPHKKKKKKKWISISVIHRAPPQICNQTKESPVLCKNKTSHYIRSTSGELFLYLAENSIAAAPVKECYNPHYSIRHIHQQ